jgi:hypothetical protein
MRKLIISPQAGFGNRIRTLCAARVFGAIIDREVYHYWEVDEQNSLLGHVNQMKSITPDYIFDFKIPKWEGGQPDVAFSEWSPETGWFREQCTGIKHLKPKRIEVIQNIEQIIECKEEVILIETSQILMIDRFETEWERLMTQAYELYFGLNPRWKSIAENIPVFDYGISIRKGDFIQFYPETDVPLDAAIRLLNGLSGSKFVTCDDVQFLKELKKHCNIHIGIDEGPNQLDNSIIQFITLSKSKHVLGTKGSSFAKQASLFGNCKYNEI